ncbi:MAG: nitrate reductase gamma subunit [Clostridia bacterium]|jgi:nitrate reductase gamma subunit|nr:nitrate reductase gamma subunit [Clostridia bacterium]MDN5321627.1 nitrate reductase gamma subunit [Clostridia bacterium]
MGLKFSLLMVTALILGVFLGVEALGLSYLFGVIIPYIALATFIIGFVYRVVKWGKAPVPFRIPTTCGQQKSLSWIKQNKIENPSTTSGVVARMALEVLFFRSLFKNTKAQLVDGQRLVYQWEKWLWLGGLIFHWSFLIVVIRHFRFFLEPVPAFVRLIEKLDGFFLVDLQNVYLTGVLLLVAITYLFIRRVFIPQVRYVSLAADYFPLFVIMGIALTGILMRYFTRVDVVAVKELALGLFTFNPTVPEGISILFYIHLFLVCVLISYFPFSKLMHMGGIFLSPTRNMANNNRAVRHINPWNYPVKVHTYEEYEDEFRDKMRAVGLPLEKDGTEGEKEAATTKE